jgi:hypothetical protein
LEGLTGVILRFNTITYVHTENDRPLAYLLADRECILNVPVEHFFSSGPLRRKTHITLCHRLERQPKQIERPSAKPKQQILSITDTIIEAEQNRNGPRS